MSLDPALGYVYLPASTPSNDSYGGECPGDNLFGDSVVCLDARTGVRVWHFQIAYRGVWDYDPPAAPTLVDIKVDGKPIKAVVQLTKQAFCFVFDRGTAAPVWPVVEMPVPASAIVGEADTETQPIPVWPRPYDRQGLRVEDLIDFTPELRQMAMEAIEGHSYGSLYAPPAEKSGFRTRPLGWPGLVSYVPSKTMP